MPLLPIEIPPGVVSVGTDFENSGRWQDSHLVRWRDGTIRPVGGWRSWASASSPVRGMFAWAENDGSRWVAAGTYNSLEVSAPDGTVSDITPVGLTSGNSSAAQNQGFGGGLYGRGFYGTERPEDGTFTAATVWTMDSWGEYLVACSNDDGKLYEWQLDTATPAAAITNAPTGCNAVMVTEERFVFALGAGGNPRKVQWCDQEDNTTWTAAATNQAGSQLLETQGEIMCGHKSRGVSFILTNVDAHVAIYRGPGNFVYGFERVGSNCGVISQQAAATIGPYVYWMGQNNFYVFDGSVVREIPCSVADFVFDNINTSQRSLVCAIPNAQHGEVWWFFPGKTVTENDRYVAYDANEDIWQVGYIGRTSGVDRSVQRYPVWAGTDGTLYEHEIGDDHGTETPYLESGPISVGAGDSLFTAVHLYPDEKTQGDVTVTVKTRRYPNGTETSHGPYTMAAPTSVRFTGRQMRVRYDQNVETPWRVGVPRFEVRERGAR